MCRFHCTLTGCPAFAVAENGEGQCLGMAVPEDPILASGDLGTTAHVEESVFTTRKFYALCRHLFWFSILPFNFQDKHLLLVGKVSPTFSVDFRATDFVSTASSAWIPAFPEPLPIQVVIPFMLYYFP